MKYAVTVSRPGPMALAGALALTGYYEAVTLPAPGEWTRYRDLVSPAGIAGLVERAIAVCGGGDDPSARTAAVGLALGGFASPLAFALTGAECGGDGALRFDPDTLAFRVEADGVTAIGVPAAGVTVSSGSTASGSIAEHYVELLEPLIEAVQPMIRRGRRALWTDVADRLVTGFFYNCRALGLTDASERAAELLATAPPELRHRLRLLDVPHGGDFVPWKRRAVCCLAYRTERWAGEYCGTCPLITEEETVRRLQQVWE